MAEMQYANAKQVKEETKGKLDAIIAKAKKKLGVNKENAICRYIPVSTGGYIHHFTMRKMKTENPQELESMIVKYIIGPVKPLQVVPKKRAARGFRKRSQYAFTKQDIERLLEISRLVGDKDMIRKLTRPKDLRTLKRELISSIRHGKVVPELWESFVEAITSQNQNPAQEQTANNFAS